MGSSDRPLFGHSSYRAVRERFEDFRIVEQPDYCSESEPFAAWVNGLLNSVLQEPTEIVVNQAMILLQDKWHEYRGRVPKSHRFFPRSHTCLWQIYEKAYEDLRDLRSAIAPPKVCETPPQPKISLPGLILGEFAEE